MSEPNSNKPEQTTFGGAQEAACTRCNGCHPVEWKGPLCFQWCRGVPRIVKVRATKWDAPGRFGI